MPMYEYRCPKCGHTVEKLQGFDAEAPTCEKGCTEEKTKEPVKTKRLISQTSFHLKGGGWAKDGYGG